MAGHTLDSRLDGALGGKTAAALERAFGMRTVGDLLAHYPRRYALRGELTPISSLPIGEPVTIVAEVRRATERRMQNRKGSILEVLISDGQGDLSLTFFNQSWRIKELQPGRRGIFAGKVGEYRGAKQLAHPDYELFDDEDAARLNAQATRICRSRSTRRRARSRAGSSRSSSRSCSTALGAHRRPASGGLAAAPRPA